MQEQQGDVTIKLDRTEYIENDCKHYVIYYYKAIDVCGNDFSPTQTFTSGGFTTNTNNVFNNTSIKIQPNVVNEGSIINLNVRWS